jgi:MFS family permease
MSTDETLTAWSSVAMYIVARIVLGFGILFAIVAGSSLIGELAYPKERAVLTSLFNASYFVGSILAASIAIGKLRRVILSDIVDGQQRL